MKVIEARGLTKRFGTFTAVDGIDLSVEEGEIKAIVGENGAGKTTLMNMLYGLLKPSAGTILVRGREVRFRSPLDAIDAGLGMVHQHFKLAGSLSVFENILLGVEVRRSVTILGRRVNLPLIDLREERRRVRQLIEAYKLALDPEALVSDISIGAKQRVEILKMLYRDVDILILDEPTAVLTPQEVEALAVSLKELKARGKTLLIITHKLGEVMAMSDSVTVIKKGRVAGNVATVDTSERELAQMMVGRDVVLGVANDRRPCGARVGYSVKDLKASNEQGREILHDISFSIHEGEVLGIAGVEGNGQSELMQALTGLLEIESGSVFCGEGAVTNLWPDELRKRGIGIIPEDRYAHGLCRGMSITANCAGGYHFFPDLCRFGVLDRKAMTRKRENLVATYDIRAADCESDVAQLSGGNAQKIIIARELDRDPKVILASQPTRGVDVGSIEYIHTKLLELKTAGKAILIISSELSEIMSLSDRVLVMYRGAIIGEESADTMTRERLGLLMAGVRTGGGEETMEAEHHDHRS